MTAVAEEKRVAQWKLDEVAELESILKDSKTIIIASVDGFPSDKLHDIRKKLRNKALIRVTKNTLIRIAMKRANIDTEKLDPYLTGPNAYILTSGNPFEVNMVLSKFKLKRFAVPGDKADEDIVIPAGDTGIAAGPMLSVFGKLKIQTKVQDGKIHVAKDTLAVKKGDPIPAELTPILQKLGIQPVYLQLRIKAAYYDNLVFKAEDLAIDLERYARDISLAFSQATQLGVEAALPLTGVVDKVLMKAFRNSLALSAEAGYVTPETAEAVLGRAMAKAMALMASISGKVDLGVSVPAQPVAQAPAQEAKKEEKKEEEEKKGPSEDEIAGGLAGLFG